MKNFYIFTLSFVEYESGKLKIGGLQTYIKDLAILAYNRGYEVVIYQMEDVPIAKIIEFKGFYVKFVKVGEYANVQACFDVIHKNHMNEDAVFVIASDQYDIKSEDPHVIAIQHGVAFDIPGFMIKGFWGRNRVLQHVNKMFRCIKNVQRFYMICNTVCVDYNYYNWLRTIGSVYPEKKVTVIPNYCSHHISKEELSEKLAGRIGGKRIVFARRYVDYRGTFLFANVIKRLFVEHPEIDVTFAGEGPCKKAIIQMFNGDTRVHFSSFETDESISFHKRYDIAVVPTIFSEGTSLSLCEAMAAGCFPVCTYVGGMTNIIINGFNGLSCAPLENDLFIAIKNAVEMPEEKFNAIVNNSFSSVIEGFGIENWRKKWGDFIDEVACR